MDHVISQEKNGQLIQIVNEGAAVMQEVPDLNEELTETIKAVAE